MYIIDIQLYYIILSDDNFVTLPKKIKLIFSYFVLDNLSFNIFSMDFQTKIIIYIQYIYNHINY